MKLFQLFFEFFKIGLFAVGGGNATIPFLLDLSDKTNWFTRSELYDMQAISESTPGAIGVNMSTFVGYKTIFTQNNYLMAICGGALATFGIILPSLIIIIIISKMLDKFKGNKYVGFTFYGLKAASCGLIAYATYIIMSSALTNEALFGQTANFLDWFNSKAIIYGVVLAFFLFKYKKHPIFYIAISAIVGIIFNFSG